MTHSSPENADIEEAARIIYNAFPFDGNISRGEKPQWLPGGNSRMQNRARRTAYEVLKLRIRAQPDVPPENADDRDQWDLQSYLDGKAIRPDGRVRLDISFNELKKLRAALRVWAAGDSIRAQCAPDPCAQFVMWALMEGSWQGCNIDGGAAQDKAVDLGLIVVTEYDPEKHGESDCCDPGDTWYVPSPALLAALGGTSSSSPKCEPFNACLPEGDPDRHEPPAIQPQRMPATLSGQIAAIYGELDPEDSALVDREWARMRGYILPSNGRSTLTRPDLSPAEKTDGSQS